MADWWWMFILTFLFSIILVGALVLKPGRSLLPGPPAV